MKKTKGYRCDSFSCRLNSRTINPLKQKISIFFILLANVVILAHAVVPHHHHNRAVAVLADVTHGDWEHIMEHHHHDSPHDDSDSDECAIDDSAAAVCLSQKRDLVEKPLLTPTGDDGNWDSFSLALVAVLAKVQSLALSPPGNAHFLIPYHQGFHSDFIALALGLRAPPFC